MVSPAQDVLNMDKKVMNLDAGLNLASKEIEEAINTIDPMMTEVDQLENEIHDIVEENKQLQASLNGFLGLYKRVKMEAHPDDSSLFNVTTQEITKMRALEERINGFVRKESSKIKDLQVTQKVMVQSVKKLGNTIPKIVRHYRQMLKSSRWLRNELNKLSEDVASGGFNPSNHVMESVTRRQSAVASSSYKGLGGGFRFKIGRLFGR